MPLIDPAPGEAFISAADEIRNLRAEIKRLQAALQVCAADWISAPGTVMSAAQGLSAEFRRRMEIAAAALK